MAKIDLEDEEDSFLQKHGMKIGIGVVVLAVAGYMAFGSSSGGKTASNTSKKEMFIMPALPPIAPPPPPPPPPPKPEPPKEEEKKDDETKPVEVVDEKPMDKPATPDEPAPISTSITGPGEGSGLAAGNGMGGGNGTGIGGPRGKVGSLEGWYAGQVQKKVLSALQNNKRTRTASMNVKVRVWPDSTGRITKADLEESTGDPGMDATLRNDILTGIQMAESPPKGMKFIRLHLKLQRPS
jgi:outer membrane biosynthesis protein TonB